MEKKKRTMSRNNVPDDWNCYWITCPECNHRWHLSEGNSCEKCEQQKRWNRESTCGFCGEELLLDEDLNESICIENDEYYFCNVDCLNSFEEELKWKEDENKNRRETNREE